jgi:hypothetical protein
MKGDNPEYDSYGFRVGSSQAALGEATPQVVLQNRVRLFVAPFLRVLL